MRGFEDLKMNFAGACIFKSSNYSIFKLKILLLRPYLIDNRDVPELDGNGNSYS